MQTRRRLLSIMLSVAMCVILLCGCSSDSVSDIIASASEAVSNTVNNAVSSAVDSASDKVSDVVSSAGDTLASKAEDFISGVKETVETPENSFNVHFIDVGQGDCTLIECDGEYMLIDAGDNDKGTLVQNYLQKQGVKTLKYVIGTHPDADHIGGLDVVIYKFDCEIIWLSNMEKTTATYRDVISAIDSKSYKWSTPAVGSEYTLGSATFTILGPVNSYDDANNNSIALIMYYGNTSFLFTGDAETEEESDIVDGTISIDCDVYQAGHHGSYNASSEKLLDSATPESVVISCGEGNEYGHPRAEMLNRLMERGISVYRTDESGSIIATSDGNTITWDCPASTSWKAGEPIGSLVSSTTQASGTSGTTSSYTGTYILNTNSMKIHLPDCESVVKMSDENKAESDSIEELIEQGYTACKQCLQ